MKTVMTTRTATEMDMITLTKHMTAAAAATQYYYP